MKEVRILTKFYPLEFKTVPFSEIPPGCRLEYFQNQGEIYVMPEVSEPNGIPAIRHPRFPVQIREILRQFEKVFEGFSYIKKPSWRGLEDSLRRDRFPWQEIARMHSWTDALKRFEETFGTADLEKKLAICSLAKYLQNAGRHNVEDFKNGSMRVRQINDAPLTQSEIDAITRWITSDHSFDLWMARNDQFRRIIRPFGLSLVRRAV